MQLVETVSIRDNIRDFGREHESEDPLLPVATP